MKTSALLEIDTGRGLMPAYVAVPTTEPPWPGVVVIHDFTGMSQDLQGHARWLAGEGFLAIAPDLYYWGSRLRCARIHPPRHDHEQRLIRPRHHP